ncbi:MAG: MerR family transcriptional regulator [Lacticaseibacillus songhuajiangensis]|jgi:DNA-binding transcriptional MerR regulator|nr:MerR family transcriptional regulator [Lacticaseibacillus songhuajiangensis]
MDYSISEFSALTGVSERTLRYYHARGLLHPSVAANGYRRFNSTDADTLQLIRFYTAAGFTLDDAAHLLQADQATRTAALRKQRAALRLQQQRLSTLIAQVDATIANQEDDKMTDTAKFAAFKQEQLTQNDVAYGDEVAERWDRDAKAAADRHYAGISEAQYQQAQQTEQQLADVLHAAVAAHADPNSELGLRTYALHRQWLEVMWPQYNAVMHRGLMDMYANDDRFAQYYEQLGGSGASQFLIAAVQAHAAD